MKRRQTENSDDFWEFNVTNYEKHESNYKQEDLKP